MDQQFQEPGYVTKNLPTGDFSEPGHSGFVRNFFFRQSAFGFPNHRNFRNCINPNREIFGHWTGIHAKGLASLSRQCEILAISRSSLYYTLKGESPANLALMRRIDELFLKYSFYGSRQMVRQLRREGVCIGRHRVRRLMRLMGLQAIYQKPRTSDPHPEHRIYPYLLRNMRINRSNQVWCADITYIPVQRGFLYLVAIMDWATRHVLAWRLSNTMDVRFCIEALNEALARYGKPDIFNAERPNSALAGRTLAEAYGCDRPVDMMDKPDGLPTSPPAQQQRRGVINRVLVA